MTPTAVVEQYPSTDDLITEIEDPVLAILIGARERIALNHTQTAHIGEYGAVCGIGAVWAEDGITRQTLAKRLDLGCDSQELAVAMAKDISDAAKTAIVLLNETAVDLFPEAR